MKRCFSLIFALVLCLTLFACSKQPTNTPPVDTPPIDAPPTAVPPAEQPNDPPAQTPVTPPEEPVPADPLPGEQVAPEIPQVTSSPSMFTFTDDSQNPLLVLTTGLPSCESLPQITGYYKAIYDDLYAVCKLNTEDAARQKAEAQTMGQEFSPWQTRVMCVVTRNNGVTLSVMRTVIEEWGQQETMNTYAETFDVASQGRLLLGDLFQKNTDYVSRLPVTEPDQLNFAFTDGFLLLCTQEETVSVPLSDLSDILLPQYITE